MVTQTLEMELVHSIEAYGSIKMLNKKDILYIASLSIGLLITIVFLLHYNVYLWGKPAAIYIFTEKNCSLCEEFVGFAEEKLSDEGYDVKICYLDLTPQCNNTFNFLKKTGLPDIVPLTVIIRKGQARGIVLDDWKGMPFWYVMRDTDLNGTNIIPVFKHGDLIGFISSDECLIKNLVHALEKNDPSIIEKRCGPTGNYTYVHLGSFEYKPPKFY